MLVILLPLEFYDSAREDALLSPRVHLLSLGSLIRETILINQPQLTTLQGQPQSWCNTNYTIHAQQEKSQHMTCLLALS